MLIVTGYVHVPAADVGASARDGCLFYAVAPDDAAAGRMLVAERWRDEAALGAHMAAADTVAFVERWARRMRGDLAVFTVSGRAGLTVPGT